MASDTPLWNLEAQYRACACRSTTPYFSERKVRHVSAHVYTARGKFYRTLYQHDRDKVLYSRFFRRLRLKTQIYPESTDDHLRTRLDHTLEVAQIARHFARQLQLNEDLVDAIALAHDIGHTPFGHSGERALHTFLADLDKERIRKRKRPRLDGFKHNWQGLRVVDLLDKSYPEQDGLGLTRAVRIGILLHTNLKYRVSMVRGNHCFCDLYRHIRNEFRDFSPSIKAFEIQICTLSDEIAQLMHDLEDALISKEMDLAELLEQGKRYPLIARCIKSIVKQADNRLPDEWKKLRKGSFNFDNKDAILLLMARLRSQMIFEVSRALVTPARQQLDEWEKQNLRTGSLKERVKRFDDHVESEGVFPDITVLPGKIGEEFAKLRDEIERQVVNSARVNRMDGKADYILKHILEVYLSKPAQVPQAIMDQFAYNAQLAGISDGRKVREDRNLVKRLGANAVFIRAVVDYVAGMTDRFALMEYDRLYSAYPRKEL